jgi:uncharacterized protein YpuA (DUF1002 family)
MKAVEFVDRIRSERSKGPKADENKITGLIHEIENVIDFTDEQKEIDGLITPYGDYKNWSKVLLKIESSLTEKDKKLSKEELDDLLNRKMNLMGYIGPEQIDGKTGWPWRSVASMLSKESKR